MLHFGCELVQSDSFVHIKMSYYWFNRQELLQKAKNKYHNCGGKEKAAEYYLENRVFFWKNKQNISIETCQKNKKKQKVNMERIDTEKWNKMQDKILIFCIV